jgi:plastocyanin
MSGPNFAKILRTFATSISAIALLAISTTANAASFVINVGGAQNGFNPATLAIKPGDTVTFINKGGLHNVVADDGSFRCARGCDGDGHGGNGAASHTNWIATVAFPNAGNIGYFCETHGAPGQGMFGTITVAIPTAPTPPTVPIPNGGWKFYALLACVLTLAAAARLVRRRKR